MFIHDGYTINFIITLIKIDKNNFNTVNTSLAACNKKFITIILYNVFCNEI